MELGRTGKINVVRAKKLYETYCRNRLRLGQLEGGALLHLAWAIREQQQSGGVRNGGHALSRENQGDFPPVSRLTGGPRGRTGRRVSLSERGGRPYWLLRTKSKALTNKTIKVSGGATIAKNQYYVEAQWYLSSWDSRGCNTS